MPDQTLTASARWSAYGAADEKVAAAYDAKRRAQSAYMDEPTPANDAARHAAIAAVDVAEAERAEYGNPADLASAAYVEQQAVSRETDRCAYVLEAGMLRCARPAGHSGQHGVEPRPDLDGKPAWKPADLLERYAAHCDYCARWAVARGAGMYAGQALCAIHYNQAKRAGNER